MDEAEGAAVVPEPQIPNNAQREGVNVAEAPQNNPAVNAAGLGVAQPPPPENNNNNNGEEAELQPQPQDEQQQAFDLMQAEFCPDRGDPPAMDNMSIVTKNNTTYYAYVIKKPDRLPAEEVAGEANADIPERRQAVVLNAERADGANQDGTNQDGGKRTKKKKKAPAKKKKKKKKVSVTKTKAYQAADKKQKKAKKEIQKLKKEAKKVEKKIKAAEKKKKLATKKRKQVSKK